MDGWDMNMGFSLISLLSASLCTKCSVFCFFSFLSLFFMRLSRSACCLASVPFPVNYGRRAAVVRGWGRIRKCSAFFLAWLVCFFCLVICLVPVVVVVPVVVLVVLLVLRVGVFSFAMRAFYPRFGRHGVCVAWG
jgi:hypothetical protein